MSQAISRALLAGIPYACTSVQHLFRQQSRSDQKIDAAVATNMERNAAHRQPPAPCLY